jgi:hypothetical protein
MFQNLVNDCVEYLDLKWPWEIKIKHSKGKGNLAEYTCWYYKSGKRKHIITVWFEAVNQDTRNLESIIAHEFIHAWQEERGYIEIHGPEFQRMATKLESFLFMRNFHEVDRIYIREVDL